MSEDGFFTLSLKSQSVVIEPGDWVRLDFDLTDWLNDGYAVLTYQLYAEPFDDFAIPTDIRTRLQREKEGEAPDFTAECVHAVSDDWAIDHTTMMYVRRDTPVAVTVRVSQAPMTLHTLIYRGVSLADYAKVAVSDALIPA